MIGVDLVYIPEFANQKKLGGDKLLTRAFDDSELSGSLEHSAGIWAAKEAVIKAMGNPKTEPKEVKLKYSKNGQPSAMCHKKSFDVSISHHGDYAIAVAIEVLK
ncbi:MAG: 4'-phosphopantetheinyl transferase superfamily protein [Candidatus Saccharibacteria bacterium]